MRGTYVLLIEVEKEKSIQVGKLGKFTFCKGFYVYVGSAKNNLDKRVERHIGRGKKLFWHIDYLLSTPEVKVREVWVKEGEWECHLARRMARSRIFQVPVREFGSSDCTCKAHLFGVSEPGKETEFFRRNNLFLLDPGIESDKLPSRETFKSK